MRRLLQILLLAVGLSVFAAVVILAMALVFNWTYLLSHGLLVDYLKALPLALCQFSGLIFLVAFPIASFSVVMLGIFDR
jgi:hypothetical protein